MFTCPVCKRRFGHLTSLINHKKVHKKYYQIKNNTDTSTDEKVEDDSVTSTEDDSVTSVDEKVEDDTDTSTDKKFEDDAETSADEKVESNINTSMDEDDTNTYFVDDVSLRSDDQDIVDNPNIIDQIITCESGQIFEETLEEWQTPQFRQMIQSTFHKCMNILFEPLHLQYRLGVLFKVNSRYLKCNMMLSCVIGDWPENCKYCLTYSGANCAHPCHTCLVEKDKLNAINLPSNHKIIRTENLMRQIMKMGKCKDYSLREETNSFWTHL
ncbi:12676_t:CDS:2 [Cetraspora pellucida]|uniref:12676_t:CDS:1 n=1 Tax=Cetraspora pellucida TaxID=1433469 RepID=A0A9N9NA50_9GLOM|nr:12676_t:CDS:2 [Cetraspora pellucida]